MVAKNIALALVVVTSLMTSLMVSPAGAETPKLDGSTRDRLSLTLGLGGSIFYQGLRASKRFIIGEKEDPFVQLKEIPDPSQAKAIVADNKIPIDVSWLLGYTYVHQLGSEWTQASGIADDSHVFEVGLGADLARRLAMDVTFGLQGVSAESFTHGMLKIGLSYVVPLRGARRGEVGEEIDARDTDGVVDARAEYQREREREVEARLEVPPDVTFPQMRFGAKLHFSRYRQEPSTSPRPAAVSLSSTLGLEQSLAGPEVIYAPSARVNFRLLALFGYFNGDLDLFTSYQTQGVQRSPGGLALMVEHGFHELLLLYPRRVLHLTAQHRVTERWEIRGFLSQLAPKATGRSTIYSIGTYVQGDINSDWQLGFGVDGTFQSDLDQARFWLSGLGRLGYKF